MKQYIGTKLVQATMAWKVTAEGHTRYEDYEKNQAGIFGESVEAELGYRVKYADGYESWSPKLVFEAAYLPLTTNDGLKTDKPSISQEMVDRFISAYEVKTMGEKCTVVRATLRNGFEIVEYSACVSRENYDEALGAEICKKKIRDKVWELLGFLLQTAVSGSVNCWVK